MAYFFVENREGMPAITNIDSGYKPANASSYIPSAPTYPGMVARAVDPTYGEGEFILLNGCASTLVGSIVNYNTSSFTTTLMPNTANLAQPFAIAMSANNATTTWGWYQISGVATILKTSVNVSPNVVLYQSATAGRVMSTAASGKQLLGTRSANAATVASATSTITAIIDRPHMQGRVS